VEFGEETCCICFDDYLKENTIRKLLRCGHIFHGACVENWFANKIKEPKCPLCNLNVIEEE
jgi:RING-H2 zinc finger protein RHA1